MLLTGLLASCLLGCEGVGQRTIEPERSATPASPAPSRSALLARVNGQALPIAPLNDALLSDYGLPIAQQFIADEVVRQELIRQGMATEVTDMEVEAETARALGQIFRFLESPSQSQLEGLLQQFLRKNNFTRRQWDATMRRNAQLARLAAPKVNVTEEQLRSAYYQIYGARRIVRHIQVESMAKAQKVLDELEAGKDFASLAETYSASPTGKEGGLLPPISMKDPPKRIPPALLQVAMAMEKPGEISNPIQTGTSFHILKYEELVPPEGVTFEEVRDKLVSVVRDQQIGQMQQEILADLIGQAEIEYVNPIIRAQKSEASQP